MGDHQDPVILASYGSHKGGVNAVQFRPHMKHVVSGGADFAVLLWSLHCRTNLRYPIVRPYRFLGHQVTRLSSFLPSCSSCGLLSFVLSEILSSTAASISINLASNYPLEREREREEKKIMYDSNPVQRKEEAICLSTKADCE
jgi:WD40 repeat protein